MPIVGFGLFCFFVILITVLQTFIAYIYFEAFFRFQCKKRIFIGSIFCYMVVIKFLHEDILHRMIVLIIFMFLLAFVTLFGSIEKKIYHVLSFVFSLILCEITYSTFNNSSVTNIHTEYLKWMILYFMFNVLFCLMVIGIMKLLMFFKEENTNGLTNKEYLLLSIIPLASIIIIYFIEDVSRISKSICCLSLILINVNYMIIYNKFAKENYERQKFLEIEKQNQYYKEQIVNQEEFVKMRHDLKNVLIAIDSCIFNNDIKAAKEQLSKLINAKVLSHDEYTGCVVIDSVLNVKLQKMKECGIRYKLNSKIPWNLNFKDNVIIDISAILGNILDNATEGVLRLNGDKEGEIDIAIQYDKGKLIFIIRNTSNSMSTDFSNVLIRSEKGKRYGIGINSIKERVDRLNGYYDFVYNSGIYTVLIVIPI